MKTPGNASGVCVIMMVLVSLSGVIRADEPRDADHSRSLAIDLLLYCDNLEFFNEYRAGHFYLGTQGGVRYRRQPSGKLSFHAGIAFQNVIGDDSFLAEIRPVFQGIYHSGVFRFVLGELLSDSTHGLPDALLRREWLYETPCEEGMQFYISSQHFQFDFWCVYDALNTPAHREHLMVGNRTAVSFHGFTVSSLLYIDHHGGQDHAPPDDPVRENAAGGLQVMYRRSSGGIVREWGTAHSLLLSSTTSNRDSLGYEQGSGILGRGWVDISRTLIELSAFTGRNFVAWQGNPMYRTDGLYGTCSVSRHNHLSSGVSIAYGVRLDFLDTSIKSYLKKPEHILWVRMTGDLKIL